MITYDSTHWQATQMTWQVLVSKPFRSIQPSNHLNSLEKLTILIHMRNIEIIDGALNGRFEIYSITDQTFSKLFPLGQGEIYLEDLSENLQEDEAFWNRVYAQEIDRQTVQGVHGILHTHPRPKMSVT